MTSHKTTKEGFWYSEQEPHYPKPQPNTLSQEDADAICALILEKEKKAKINRWKGWSKSRITGERVGTTDFELDNWCWPEGYAEHYVKTHRCCPTPAFLGWLKYKWRVNPKMHQLYNEASHK